MTNPITTDIPFVDEQYFAQEAAKPASVIGAAVRAAAPSPTPLPARRAAAITQLPVFLNNRRRWQQSAYTQDNLQTAPDGSQAFVGVDKDLKQFVAKRPSIDSNKWQVVDVSAILGPQVDDSHNTPTLTLLPDGNWMLAGNVHAAPLNWGITTTPGDITTFVKLAVPANADQATYVMHPPAMGTGAFSTRTQFQFWRNGLATSGDFYYRRYDPSLPSKFTEPVKLFNGIVSNEGAYLNRIATRGLMMALFFLWRGSGDASTNTDLGYVQGTFNESTKALTFTRIDGSPQTVPITHANAQTILPTPIESGAINQCGATINRNFQPLAIEQFYAADGSSHLYLVTYNYDTATWNKEDITPEWVMRNETIGATTLFLNSARPQIISTASGKTYVLARTIGENLRGRPIIIDVSPGASRRPAFLFDHDLNGWEPAFDATALADRDELHMMMTPIDQNSDSKTGWTKQAGWIFIAPCDYLPDIVSGRARIGGITTIRQFPFPALVNNAVETVDGPILYPNPRAAEQGQAARIQAFMTQSLEVGQLFGQGVKLFVRLSLKASFETGTTTGRVYVRVQPSAGSLPVEDVCSLEFVNSSLTGVKQTPWEPLANSPYVETNGTIRASRFSLRGSCNNAAGIALDSVVIEVGILESF